MPNYTPCEQICFVLKLVPPGFVVSYGQLADLAGLPGRARYVGRCLRETSASVPWHRVLRTDGKLAFPSTSATFSEQHARLTEEGIRVINGRVSMKDYRWHPDTYTLLAELPF